MRKFPKGTLASLPPQPSLGHFRWPCPAREAPSQPSKALAPLSRIFVVRADCVFVVVAVRPRRRRRTCRHQDDAPFDFDPSASKILRSWQSHVVGSGRKAGPVKDPVAAKSMNQIFEGFSGWDDDWAKGAHAQGLLLSVLCCFAPGSELTRDCARDIILFRCVFFVPRVLPQASRHQRRAPLEIPSRHQRRAS
eukprot:702275-Pyramimonas_sp.AAC.1